LHASRLHRKKMRIKGMVNADVGGNRLAFAPGNVVIVGVGFSWNAGQPGRLQ